MPLRFAISLRSSVSSHLTERLTITADIKAVTQNTAVPFRLPSNGNGTGSRDDTELRGSGGVNYVSFARDFPGLAREVRDSETPWQNVPLLCVLTGRQRVKGWGVSRWEVCLTCVGLSPGYG